MKPTTSTVQKIVKKHAKNMLNANILRTLMSLIKNILLSVLWKMESLKPKDSKHWPLDLNIAQMNMQKCNYQASYFILS